MQFDFQSAINALNDQMPFGDNFSFRNSRAQAVPTDYLWNTILPDEPHPSYHVNGGSMRIYPTMAQMIPMDTPPKPIGAMESSFFNENTAKWGGAMHFPEERLRALQEMANYIRSQGITDGLSIGAIQDAEAKRVTETLLGFSDILTRSMWDTYEWLRSQAMCYGSISLTNSGLDLTVDYDIPATNKQSRTSTNSYYNSASKWWTDVRATLRLLSNTRFIMNSNTYYSIIDNDVNKIRVVDGTGNSRSIIRYTGSTEQNSTDARDRMSIILYDKSGSGVTPKGVMKALPFLPDGKVVVIGEQQADGFELIQGSTPDPTNLYRLGYTHIAPTVEGGRPGIYSRVFTPEAKPMQLLGEVYSNALPVILNPKKIVILTTEMPS